MSNAAKDLDTAYKQARAEPASANNPAALDGATIGPGVYVYGAAVSITTKLTITGNCGDVVVISIGAALTLGAGAQVVLKGGITAASVYWATVGAISTGAGSVLQGTLLSIAAINFGANSLFTGMAYSEAALNLGAGTAMYTPMACQASDGTCHSPCGGNACPMPNANAYSAAPCMFSSHSSSSSTSFRTDTDDRYLNRFERSFFIQLYY